MSLALLGSKVGHQVVSLALPHCLGMPYWHYQLVLSLYLHQPESHQFSLHKVLESLSLWERTGPIDRTPGTPGSDNYEQDDNQGDDDRINHVARSVETKMQGNAVIRVLYNSSLVTCTKNILTQWSLYFVTCVRYILSNVHLGLNFIPFCLVAVQIGADWVSQVQIYPAHLNLFITRWMVLATLSR